MAIEFKLPDLGENIDSVDVINLLVNEGDRIEADQPVVEIETDKAVVEVPCPHAGKVSKIHVSKGDKVSVGGLLLSLETSDSTEEDGSAPESEEDETAETTSEEKPKEEENDDEEEQPAPQPNRQNLQPRRRSLPRIPSRLLTVSRQVHSIARGCRRARSTIHPTTGARVGR